MLSEKLMCSIWINCFRETDSSIKATLLHEGCGFNVDGFPQSHCVTDGFSRCRLCKMDLASVRRGFTALREQWKLEEHHFQENQLRLQLGVPLVKKNFVEALPRGQKRQRAKVVGAADVHLESEYGVSVNDVLDADVQLEPSSWLLRR